MAEAAKLINCSRSHAYKLVQSGELPSVKLGSTLRVPRVAIDGLIEAKLAESGYPNASMPVGVAEKPNEITCPR